MRLTFPAQPPRRCIDALQYVLRSLPRCIASLLCTVFATGPCSAFESGEHCALSNFALALALEYADSDHSEFNVAAQEITKLKAAFGLEAGECPSRGWPRPRDIEFSYGKITALVDAQSSLEDAFLQYGNVTRGAESKDDLSATYFGNGASLQQRFPLASHNNILHFQGLLMSAFARWHESALAVARRDGNLFQALADQAIADHFLHDFFAPGHIVTARDNLPDVVALSWHDRYNALGLPLIVRNWAELQPIANFLGNTAAKDPRWDHAFAALGGNHAVLSTPSEGSWIARARSALELSKDASCSSDSNDNYIAWPELLLAVSPVQRAESAQDMPVLCVYGDGALASADRARDNRILAQKLLIVTIQTRYILNVLREYRSKRSDTSAFPEYVWCPQMTTGSFSVTATDAAPATFTNECQRYLQIAADLHRTSAHARASPACSDGRRGCRLYTAPIAVTRYAAYVLTASNSIRFNAFDPILALTTAVRAGRDVFNTSIGIETLPLGIPGARDYIRDVAFRDLRLPNLGIALGLELPLSGDDYFRHAYTARLVLALPRLDTQISLYGKEFSLSANTRDVHALGYGVRFDTGFSLLTLFIAVGREPVRNGSDVDHSTVLTSGVTFSLSSRRVFATAGKLFR